MALLRLAALALALCTGTVLLAGRIDPGREKPYDVAVVPRAAALRWLSLGHPTLAANLFWLRAVQYIGEPRAEERGWGTLYPLVDLVTDLDPGHGYAYQVAGVLLGTAGLVPESNAILEKGIARVPDRYILPYLRAFNAFYYQGDWPAAGRFAELAARTPGAPAHVRQNVLAFYVKGKRADAAIAFLEEVRRATPDEDSRKAIDEQLRQARLEAAAARVEDAIAAYQARHLVGPLYLERLVEDGLLDRLPDDPFGGVLRLDDELRVRSSKNPYRFRPAPRPGEMDREPALGGGGRNR